MATIFLLAKICLWRKHNKSAVFTCGSLVAGENPDHHRDSSREKPNFPNWRYVLKVANKKKLIEVGFVVCSSFSLLISVIAALDLLGDKKGLC